jgi:hypothetical protein
MIHANSRGTSSVPVFWGGEERRPSLLARAVRALIESRRREAERSVAEYLHRRDLQAERRLSDPSSDSSTRAATGGRAC